MASGVYAITRPEGGKMYVGSAVNLDKRFREHCSALRNGTHHSMHLQRAWEKYGEGAFTFGVVEYVADHLLLIEREQVWMDFFKPAYNMAKIAGSSLGVKRTPEAKARMRAAKIGRKLSPEHRAKIGASRKGRPCNVGNTNARGARTLEQCEANRAAQIARWADPTLRAAQGIVLTGRKFSPEAKARMSAAQLRRRAAEKLMKLNTFSEATP